MNIKCKNFSAVVSFTLLKIFSENFLQVCDEVYVNSVEDGEPR